MEFLRTIHMIWGEKSAAVLNAVGGHQLPGGDIEATTPYTPIVMAADAIKRSIWFNGKRRDRSTGELCEQCKPKFQRYIAKNFERLIAPYP